MEGPTTTDNQFTLCNICEYFPNVIVTTTDKTTLDSKKVKHKTV